VYRLGVLVHCPCCLSTAATVQTAELPGGNGVFAEWALEHRKAVHHLDGVMSHNFNCTDCALDSVANTHRLTQPGTLVFFKLQIPIDSEIVPSCTH
jgi:hypothetical protein